MRVKYLLCLGMIIFLSQLMVHKSVRYEMVRRNPNFVRLSDR
jgi:hypothetical protein